MLAWFRRLPVPSTTSTGARNPVRATNRPAASLVAKVVAARPGRPNATFAAATVGIVAIGVLDAFIDPHVRLEPLYLLPLLAVAWTSRSRGYVAAVLATCAALIGDVLGNATTTALEAAWNAAASLTVYLCLIFLLTRLHVALEELNDQATTDPLTGLLNRRAFYRAVNRELVKRARTNEPLSLVFVDVDRFKQINDRYGHEAGDAALQRVAETARETVRSTDIVARLGGDEFAICLPNTSAENAARHSRAIADAVAAIASGPELSISVGIASTTSSTATVDELLATADRRMYATRTRHDH